MKPYYERDGVTIYHGDCLAILPHLHGFDAVITSPPFNTLSPSAKPSGLHAERKSGVNEWMDKNGNYADSMPEPEYQGQQRCFLRMALQSASCAWVNHKTRYRKRFASHPLHIYAGFEIYAEVVWDRGVSMALNCRRFSPSHEFFYCFGMPRHWDDSVNKMMSVWRIPPSRDTSDHPCPYPPQLVRPLLRACVRDGGVIDPFMGVGTTIRCAKDLGMVAVGIEKEEKYCEVAAKRLSQQVLDL